LLASIVLNDRLDDERAKIFDQAKEEGPIFLPFESLHLAVCSIQRQKDSPCEGAGEAAKEGNAHYASWQGAITFGFG
jgi:hypothetical protein